MPSNYSLPPILTVCVLTMFSFTAFAQPAEHLIGNDIGVTFVDLRDDLLDQVKYEASDFDLLNLGYTRFGEQSILEVGFRYQQSEVYPAADEAISEFSFLNAYSYESLASYYRPVTASDNPLAFYLGVGQHTYFFLHHYRDNQYAYDMGIVDLQFKTLLQLKKERYQIMASAGCGIVSYGSRADYRYTLNLTEGFEYQLTAVGKYLDLGLDVRALIDLSEHFVISPVFRGVYVSNQETAPLRILRQSWLVGLYYRL